jgi:hypothetical protein
MCRNAGGVCDVAETCTGTSADCPPDKWQPAGFVCANSNGPCDAVEVCTGNGPQCPPDLKQPAGTPCRKAAGFCDAAETCDGVSALCPPDALKPAGTMCRNAGGVCDVAETCTGTSVDCPPDKWQPAGFVCANSNGPCDAVEVCTGQSPQCPPDLKLPAGTSCRKAAGFCDVPETCDGVSALCPPDVVKPAGTMCRNAGGVCDTTEFCNGSSPACPADGFLPAGTVCRNASNWCDAVETCTGTSAACPADGFLPAGTVCANSNGPCDAVEVCTGTSAQCPPDLKKPAGAVCRASTGACDPAEVCSGASSQCPADVSSQCCSPAPACNPSISINPSSVALAVTRANPQHATFLDANFKLSTVLNAILALSDAPGQTATDLYQRLWDTQRTAANGVFKEAFAPHCNDAGTTVNGFPVDCPRTEGDLATGSPDVQFRPVALFNRFDLAPIDGSHCGEYRIIYAMQGVSGRAFVIFEAQLPNPNPECGLEACRAVAQLWQGLPALDSAALGAALQSFYFTGLAGFRPVIHPQNYGFPGASGPSGGQIRVNMFKDSINWQLREFHLDRGCTGAVCRMFPKPVTDKNNPFGNLFNSSSPLALAGDFQADFINRVPGLAAPTVMGITMTTPDLFNSGQSTSQNFGAPDTYTSAFASGGGAGSPFGQQIQAKLTSIGSPLTPANIVARAPSQSCAGCHELATGLNLGGGLTFPLSQGFVQVNENGGLSSALTGTFLPHRANVLAVFLQACGGPANFANDADSMMSSEDAPENDNGGPVPTLGGSVTH